MWRETSINVFLRNIGNWNIVFVYEVEPCNNAKLSIYFVFVCFVKQNLSIHAKTYKVVAKDWKSKPIQQFPQLKEEKKEEKWKNNLVKYIDYKHEESWNIL